jgi:hypothetical protein
MYLNLEETLTKLEILAETHPETCELIQLPHLTHEGRESWAIRIHAGERPDRHGVLLIAGVHAREWGSTDILIHLLDALLGSYASNTDVQFGDKTFSAAEVRATLEALDLIVLPVVNPDGKAYSFRKDIADANEWRKNRGPIPGSTHVGVDLNRNYDFLWDFRTHFHPDSLGPTPDLVCYRGIAVSDDPRVDTYHGPEAFSEPETRNVRWLLDRYPHIRSFVDVHGVMGAIFFPWTDDEVQTTDLDQSFLNPAYRQLRGLADEPQYPGCATHPHGSAYKAFMHKVDLNRYRAIGQAMAGALHEVRGKEYIVDQSFTGMYGMPGSSKDYAYARHLADAARPKIDGFLIEWGHLTEWPDDYFFQPAYEDPPGEDKMTPVILDVCSALTELLKIVPSIPLVVVQPNPRSLGRVRVGTFAERAIRLRNLGSEPVTVGPASVDASDPPGAFELAGSLPVTAAPGETVAVPVRFTPQGDGPASGTVSLRFHVAGESIEDVRMVGLLGEGCEVAEDACVAPTFAPSSPLGCLIMYLTAPVVILLLLATIWLPGGRCRYDSYMFRLRNCREGNGDPCIEL